MPTRVALDATRTIVIPDLASPMPGGGGDVANSSPCQILAPPTTPPRCLVVPERSPLRRSLSSRRVIFPSLHASSSASCDDDVTQPCSSLQIPESTRPNVVSPCSSPSPQARSSARSHTYPALTPSERERLLSRLQLDSPPVSPFSARGRTSSSSSSDDSTFSLSSAEDRSCGSGAATPCHYPHQFKVPSVVRSVPTVIPPPPNKRSASSQLPESSLLSLMLPSFDYLINPQRRRNSESPVLSVFAPREGPISAPPPPCETCSAQFKPLAPILRKRLTTTTALTIARTTADGRPRPVVSRSVSESSDLPSLTSSVSSDSLMMDDDQEPFSSSSCHGRKNRAAVSFCSKVWVRVFERSQRERDSIWYSPRDMEGFKAEAMERIQAYYRNQSQEETKSILPTGIASSTSSRAQRLLFSHQALQAECDVLAASSTLPTSVDVCAGSIVERILVVDPHEVCLKLLSQTFQLMFPNAVIHEATSSTDALALVGPNERFDIIVVEERLDRVGKTSDLLGSGSTLMAGMRDGLGCQPLFIGVTSHPDADTQRLKQHGADVVWPKPPPSINIDLRNELLDSLSLKRRESAQIMSAS